MKSFDINKYIKENKSEWPIPMVKEIVCCDGFKMSVQASQYHYSSPRAIACFYTHVEVGFPSDKVKELMEYAEDQENPTETVYGWVPVNVVNKIVDDHGGLKE